MRVRMGTMKLIKNFFEDEMGMELTEYAVVAGLIALAVATAFTSLGTKVTVVINTLGERIVITGEPISSSN
jgi:pilus assembly protein Flp/PilA